MQHEITSRHPLLDENGHLIEAGYARSMILDYDRKAIKANALRIKEWDYYLIYNEDFGVALTVDDNSYMALDSISLLDFRKPWEHTNSPMKFLTLGKRNFPSSSVSGDVKGDGKGYKIEFLHTDKQRVLNFEMENFMDGKPITMNAKNYTSSDDGKEMRANIYNQWVNNFPDDAHTADGAVTGEFGEYSSQIVDPADFKKWQKIEVDFEVTGTDAAGAAAGARFCAVYRIGVGDFST